jgi:hypothetical protein
VEDTPPEETAAILLIDVFAGSGNSYRLRRWNLGSGRDVNSSVCPVLVE